MTDTRLMTVPEVADLARVEPYTVRDWTRRKLLRGTKPGKQWLYDPADVDAFLESGQNKPAERDRRRRRRAA